MLTGSNSYSGNTSLHSGKLYINGTLTSPAISVAAGATLGGTGTATPTVATLESGGIIEPGCGGIGSLTLGGLGIIGNGTLSINAITNYGSTPALNVTNPGGLNVGNNAGAITIMLAGNAPTAVGTAHLLKYAGALQGAAGISAFTLDPSNINNGLRLPTFTLSGANAGYVDVNYTLEYPVWSGAGDGKWTTASSVTAVTATNWILATPPATRTNFIGGDTPVFDDTASGGTTVSIDAADVSPNAVTFNNNSKSYTLAGSKGIAGNASLTKNGEGLLTITNSNSYTGGTTLNGGILEITSLCALGNTGSLAFGGGTLRFGAAFDLTNRVDPVASGVQATLDTHNLAVTMSGSLSGQGGLTKQGAGSLTLSAPQGYSGPTTVSGGTLKLSNQLPVSGAALWLDAADAGTLHTSGTTVTRWDNKGSYGNAVAGTATLKSGGVNGHQAVEFNGTSDYLMSDNAYENTGGTMTLFMVKKRISASATGNKKYASSMSFIGPSSNADWSTTANLSLEDSQGNDTYPNHLGGYRGDAISYMSHPGNNIAFAYDTIFNGTNNVSYMFAGGDTNATPATPVAGTTENSSGNFDINKFVIGGRFAGDGPGIVPDPGYWWNGDICEIIIYNSALSTAERQAVESYLNLKWFGSGTGSNNILPLTTALTIAGNATLDLSGSSQQVASLTGTGALTNSNPTTPATFTMGDAGSSRFSGTISDTGSSGSISLAKVGSGTATLSGTSTYSGTTTVSAGTLQFARRAALYNNAASNWTATYLVVASGATAVFNVGGADEFTTSDIQTLASLATTSTNGFANGSNIGIDTTNSGGPFTYGTVIANPNGGANARGLTKLGTGTLTLTAGNSYTGTTVIQGGLLVANHATALGSGGDITFGGGTLQFGSALNTATLAWASRIKNSTAAPVSLDTNSQTVTLAGSIPGSNTAGLTKQGAGTLVLNASQSYAGPTLVSAGTLQLLPNTALPAPANLGLWLDATSLSLANGASVSTWKDLSGNNRNATAGTAPTYVTSNTAFNHLPTVHFNGSSQYLNVDLTFLASTSYSIFAVTAKNSSNAPAYFLGNSTNSNQSNITLQCGWKGDTSLQLGQYGNDIQGTVPAYANSEVASLYGGKLDKTAGAGHYLYYNDAQINSSTNTTALITSNSGSIGKAALYQGGSVKPNYFTGDIAEILVYNTALTNAQRQSVDSYLNTKWGLGIAGLSGYGGGNILPTGTVLTVATGAFLDLNGTNQQVSALSTGGGTVQNSNPSVSSTLTLSPSGGTTQSFPGVIAGGAGLGAINLVMNGTGAQILSGTNTYSGDTTVSNGTLLVNNTSGSGVGAGALRVAPGATLGGCGIIGAASTIDGIHAPGDSGVAGIQTFSNGLAYTATSRLQWQLNANSATIGTRGSIFDGVNVTGGTFSISSGATLDLSFGGTLNFLDGFWSTAHTWTLVDLGSGVSGDDGDDIFTVAAIPDGTNNYNAARGSFSVTRAADVNSKMDVVLNWSFTGTTYEAWITSKGLSGASAGADQDLDGLCNGLEFVLGGEPDPGTEGCNSRDKLPQASHSAGNLVFTFQRADVSLGSATLTFQWATNPAFSDARTVPIGTTSSTTDGVEVVITDNGTAFDTIVITVPAAKANGNGKLFGRLGVAVP